MARLIRIGELAKRTQKSVRALHLYEERGLMAPAERSKGGFRLYTEAHVERVRYIDRLQTIGCTLEEIRSMVHQWAEAETGPEGMANLEGAYRARLRQVRATIADLERLAGQLETSLDYLAGCRRCDQPDEPVSACGTCGRPVDAGLTLITGLTGKGAP